MRYKAGTPGDVVRPYVEMRSPSPSLLTWCASSLSQLPKQRQQVTGFWPFRPRRQLRRRRLWLVLSLSWCGAVYSRGKSREQNLYWLRTDSSFHTFAASAFGPFNGSSSQWPQTRERRNNAIQPATKNAVRSGTRRYEEM